MKLKELIENYKPYNEQEKCEKEMMLYYINHFDDVLTRKNKVGHFSASNWIVKKDRTKVLMIYHNIYKSWTWTGGHADGDENLERVALKEAKEETGLENLKLLSEGIFGLQILTVDGHIKREKYVVPHLHLDCCFLWEADENESIRMKPDENSGVKWVNIDDAVELTNEKKMKPVFRKLNDKLRNMSTMCKEKWKIYDENDNFTGVILDKDNPRVWDKGMFHQGADVWIINSENKILIQKRAEVKKLEPNVWGMTGGSLILEENPYDTIVREAKEELGIDIDKEKLEFLTKFKTGNVFPNTFILREDYDIDKMIFREDEVSEAKWASIDEIDELVANGNFIKHRWEFVRDLIAEKIETNK